MIFSCNQNVTFSRFCAWHETEPHNEMNWHDMQTVSTDPNFSYCSSGFWNFNLKDSLTWDPPPFVEMCIVDVCNVNVSMPSCSCGFSEVNYAGHEISHLGLIPKTAKRIQMSQYYSTMDPNVSQSKCINSTNARYMVAKAEKNHWGQGNHMSHAQIENRTAANEIKTAEQYMWCPSSL